MRLSPALLAAVGAACVAFPAAAATERQVPLRAASPAAALDNSTTFEDSVGEDALAPDITTIVVSNNGAGLITFKINMPNRSAFTGDMILDVLVDTDANPKTGDPDSLGADYAMELFQGSINLFRWDGTTFSGSGGVPQSSLIFSYANGALTIRISAADLGNTKKFNFGVLVSSGVVFNSSTGDLDFSNSHSDLAPDRGHGFYAYTVKLKPLALVVKKFVKQPASPRAGGAFSVRLVAARNDTGAVLQSGRVTCVATVGGKRLAARTHAVVHQKATCTWTIPASARGQTITFWQNYRQFFSRFAANPGGPVDLASWPSALQARVAQGLSPLRIPRG